MEFSNVFTELDRWSVATSNIYAEKLLRKGGAVQDKGYRYGGNLDFRHSAAA